MAAEFSGCVEYGLHLSKRIYYGKGSAPVALSRQMSRSSNEYLPTAPMVYAVIPEPTIVDNPDVPSYQPYVHGRCVPPALIPLQMNGITMEIDCCFDTAFISASGTWRVHCVMAGEGCECLIAVPMGEQGSVLGVEVDVAGRLHRTELISMGDAEVIEKQAKSEDGRFLKCRQIYTLKVPKVHGGCSLSVRINWSQRLQYLDDHFCLNIPFNFPACVTPQPGKKVMKSEKVLLHINSGISSEVLCKYTSHPMKILRREVGSLSLSYEAEVQEWSTMDFDLSYSISSGDLFGGVLLQSPSLHDFDQREMFCLYVFSGQNHNWKVFKKEVVFVIDTSGSMKGSPLESTKRAVLASLSKFSPEDTFNIIAFSEDTKLFSLSMEQATSESITKATEWIDVQLVANGGTNILLPVEQAIKMLAKTTSSNSIPLIFLVTDGSVDNERQICNHVKASLKDGGTISPRLCTFGIGTFCNHYFLQMLSEIGRGIYDAAFDVDSIDSRFQRLFSVASSIILANVNVDALKHLNSLELFPTQIPDLACGCPLIISGRYNGNFPESFKLSGTSSDMSNFVLDLKAQRAKELLLDRVLARRQIDILTSHAWLLESKELEDKVLKMSKQTGFWSEYTRLILLLTNEGKKATESTLLQVTRKKFESSKKLEWKGQKMIYLGNPGVGFGNLAATAENVQPGKEIKASQAAEVLMKAASNCCGRLVDRFCCMCFLKSCMYMNDRCVVAFTQLTAALACCEVFNCCFELCECGCL